MKFVGIDIGTTSICGVILNAVKGPITSVTSDNHSWIKSEHEWERIQNPANILATVKKVLSKLLSKYPDVAGIGVTGQMHGIVYTDRTGRAVSPLYTWQDARGSRLKSKGATYAAELSRLTGYSLAPGFGMVSHWYNQEKNLVPKDAVKLCTIHDYVVMQLAGGCVPVIDPTDAASLGIFDLKWGVFDTRKLARAGIRQEFLPEIVPSGKVVGHYRGIPVCAALGDNQASFLGSVQNIKNTILLNIGTGGQISAYTEKFPAVKGLDVRPFPGGGYLMVGALLCGGKSYALLENFFRRTVALFVRPAKEIDFYSRMGKVDYAGLIDKVSVDTRFAGTRVDPSMRGSVSQLSMSNLTPEHLIAGFLDGISNELYDYYLKMPAPLRRSMRSIAGSGNGLRRNPLLCRIIDKRFARKMRIPAHREEASVGAAMTAAVGTKYFKNFQSAGSMIRYG